MAKNPASSPTPFKTKLIDIVENEWKFFGYQKTSLDGHLTAGHRESEPVFSDRVALYWKQGLNESYTGRDDIPWSAAFISWAMKTAGAGTSFPYSAQHSVYIYRAINNKLANKLSAPIVGYKLADRAVQLGDLIGYSREGSSGIGYDEAAKSANYAGHTDIVVEIGNGWISVIGGNVIDSVTKKTLAIDGNGLLVDHSKNWFVVIANNM